MSTDLSQLIGRTDIYLLDQILKNRYQQNELILDAGCGSGRNLFWFSRQGFEIHGVDVNKAVIDQLKNAYPKESNNFSVGDLSKLTFSSESYDHVICNAVLHFAENTDHFSAMFSELVRVLKPEGSLFIRMTSTIGLSEKAVEVSEGVYHLPDNSKRFLLRKSLLHSEMKKHKLVFLEPLKTVNVNDLRCMSTLVLKKKAE